MKQNENLAAFFDSKASVRDSWTRRNRYYHSQISNIMKFHVPKGSRVLDIGCGTGTLLNSLAPKHGVGVDFSRKMLNIASKKYPHLKFMCADAEKYVLNEKFDFIIISDTIGYFNDIQTVFKNIRQNCTPRTRIIITQYNYLWEPVIKFSELIGLKMKQPFTNWLSAEDIKGLLYLEEFDVVKTEDKILMPVHIPLFSKFMNKYIANLPLLRKLTLSRIITARPINLERPSEKTVSIVVPARNERGNIENIVKELPEMGKGTEIIFIEGGSKDGTWEEIHRVAKSYSTRNIVMAKQSGKGKGDAVRKGFGMAKGDVLMIYDADMTVPPKDLVKFYDAIVSNKGEFINGSRLVYPMEKQAMRLINLFGNKMFSLIFSWLLDQRLKDTLCGTKAISRADYELIRKNRSYFGDFDPFGDFDLLFGASKQDLKIVEIPIRYRERSYGQTQIRRFMHGWLLIKMSFFAVNKMKFV